MADRTNYLMPEGPARNVNALSASWCGPSLQDVIAAAAYGDARQNATIRKKIDEMRLQDAMARLRRTARGRTLRPESPRRVVLPAPEKIERSAGKGNGRTTSDEPQK